MVLMDRAILRTIYWYVCLMRPREILLTAPSRIAERTFSHGGRTEGLTWRRFSSSTRNARGKCRDSKTVTRDAVDLKLPITVSTANINRVSVQSKRKKELERTQGMRKLPFPVVRLFRVHHVWSLCFCLRYRMHVDRAAGRKVIYEESCRVTTCPTWSQLEKEDRSSEMGVTQVRRIPTCTIQTYQCGYNSRFADHLRASVS